jgi:hypothetical protein
MEAVSIYASTFCGLPTKCVKHLVVSCHYLQLGRYDSTVKMNRAVWSESKSIPCQKFFQVFLKLFHVAGFTKTDQLSDVFFAHNNFEK